MFLSTLGLKSDGIITEMVPAQRRSYDGAPIEDRRVVICHRIYAMQKSFVST